MKKILILSSVHHLEDNRIFFKETESLKKITSNITFAVQYPDSDLTERDGVKIFPLRIQKSIIKRFFTIHMDIYKLIKKERYDFIHFHDPELMLLMFYVKKKFKSKVIFDIHENIAESIKDKYWIPKYLSSTVTFLYSHIEKIFTKKLDTLIIAETSYRKTYGNDVVEILNYPWIIQKNKNLKKDFSGFLNLVYAGDIMERKGIWVMIKIYEKLCDSISGLHFDILGRFVPPELEYEVKKYIEDNNLKDKITLHGRVSINEVNRILENSHIGFSILEPVANYIGSLPTKIFDYMNNKVVVIASDFPLYKKYVDDHSTGISINFYGYNNYFDDIVNLLKSPDMMLQMAENGYTKVQNSWNWEEQEKKLLEIYNNDK